ncbi:unnamed protein product [Pedinophyceae sp. YPF-701]|nr:unnamed protein product [Pedinophyceae sp. YPF-701]
MDVEPAGSDGWQELVRAIPSAEVFRSDEFGAVAERLRSSCEKLHAALSTCNRLDASGAVPQGGSSSAEARLEAALQLAHSSRLTVLAPPWFTPGQDLLFYKGPYPAQEMLSSTLFDLDDRDRAARAKAARAAAARQRAAAPRQQPVEAPSAEPQTPSETPESPVEEEAAKEPQPSAVDIAAAAGGMQGEGELGGFAMDNDDVMAMAMGEFYEGESGGESDEEEDSDSDED